MKVRLGKIKNLGFFLKDVFDQWSRDRAMRMGAALSYYTIFSIPPLMIVAIALAGFFFGQEAAEGRIVKEIQGLIGKEGAEAIQGMIRSAKRQDASLIATIIGLGTLLIGASGVFAQLQDSLNSVWGVEPKPDRSWGDMIKERLGSFTMVFGIGFLLMVSLLIDTILTAFTDYFSHLFDSNLIALLLRFTNYGVSFIIITALFGLMYKILPDVKIAWKDVGLGAVVTSLLFVLGKSVIGLYLGNANIGVAYGAAGSLIVIMVWIFYASLIFLFGAEFTQVYTRKYGSRVEPIHGAIVVQPDKHKAPETKEIPEEVKQQERERQELKQKQWALIPIKGSKKGHSKHVVKKQTSPVMKIANVLLRLYVSNWRKEKQAR